MLKEMRGTYKHNEMKESTTESLAMLMFTLTLLLLTLTTQHEFSKCQSHHLPPCSPACPPLTQHAVCLPMPSLPMPVAQLPAWNVWNCHCLPG